MTNYVEYFRYLDNLRASGVTNMFGATPYLQRQFSLEPSEARDILGKWMTTFSDESIDVRAAKAEETK